MFLSNMVKTVLTKYSKLKQLQSKEVNKESKKLIHNFKDLFIIGSTGSFFSPVKSNLFMWQAYFDLRSLQMVAFFH